MVRQTQERLGTWLTQAQIDRLANNKDSNGNVIYHHDDKLVPKGHALNASLKLTDLQYADHLAMIDLRYADIDTGIAKWAGAADFRLEPGSSLIRKTCSLRPLLRQRSTGRFPTACSTTSPTRRRA